jgi:hypothetical protein
LSVSARFPEPAVTGLHQPTQDWLDVLSGSIPLLVQAAFQSRLLSDRTPKHPAFSFFLFFLFCFFSDG